MCFAFACTRERVCENTRFHSIWKRWPAQIPFCSRTTLNTAFIAGANLDIVSSFFCKFDEYHPYIAAIVSLWLLTIISMDRLLAISCPNRFKFIKSTYFNVLVLASVTIYSCCIFIEMPLNYSIVSLPMGNNSNATIKLCLIDIQVTRRIAWMNIANLVTVNVILNNVLNVMMIIFLYRSRKKIGQSLRHSEKRTANSLSMQLVLI